jgi:EAL domain-containing protein (putative c-di-GMP-specific phosphodiesterase class I)
MSSGRVRQVLDDLRRMGVRLSIDDFGSGSTSLSYLGRLPLSELKIDKRFVIGLGDPVNHAIVRSTIELGHNLGMQVVAEGVETLDVWRELQVLGCDYLQGYAIARPIPSIAMTSSLASRRTEGFDFSLLAHRATEARLAGSGVPSVVVAPDLADSAPSVSSPH